MNDFYVNRRCNNVDGIIENKTKFPYKNEIY